MPSLCGIGQLKFVTCPSYYIQNITQLDLPAGQTAMRSSRTLYTRVLKLVPKSRSHAFICRSECANVQMTFAQVFAFILHASRRKRPLHFGHVILHFANVERPLCFLLFANACDPERWRNGGSLLGKVHRPWSHRQPASALREASGRARRDGTRENEILRTMHARTCKFRHSTGVRSPSFTAFFFRCWHMRTYKYGYSVPPSRTSHNQRYAPGRRATNHRANGGARPASRHHALSLRSFVT